MPVDLRRFIELELLPQLQLTTYIQSKFNMWKFTIPILLVVATVRDSCGTCNTCNERSGSACISRNEFHQCFNGIPDESVTFKCPLENQICSTSALTCKQESEATLGCGDDSNCGVCIDVQDGSYSCTSRTSYTMCFDHLNSTIRQYCPDGQRCYNSKANAGIPCTSICGDNIDEMCDRDFDPDMTSPPSTTSSTTISSSSTSSTPTTSSSTEPLSMCSSQVAAGRYPHPNDTTCRTYINCYWKSSVLIGNEMKCPDNLWFDPNQRTCLDIKPVTCN